MTNTTGEYVTYNTRYQQWTIVDANGLQVFSRFGGEYPRPLVYTSEHNARIALRFRQEQQH